MKSAVIWTSLLALLLANIVSTSKISKNVNAIDDFKDEDVFINKNKPCPRDCICTVSQGYRFATCNRLEVASQKFSDDITDLVVGNSQFALTLDDNIFNKLGLQHVTTIKIVNSTIEKISPSAFHGLDKLYSVNIDHCKIEKKLNPKIFSTNKKLVLLNLANSHLKFPAQDSDDIFLNSADIQELDISYCNLKHVSKRMFSEMPGLMYLNLAGNQLSQLDVNLFKNLVDLEELDLSENNITTFPEGIFSTNPELSTLHIQKNPIDSLYGLQIPDLLRLNAGETKLNIIGPSTFNGMSLVANLNLSGNGIEEIHSDAFSKLVEINFLDLSYNDLDFISPDIIKENIELEIFKISYNPKLKALPANGFTCSAEQFDIYLFDASNCGLEELSRNALSTFTGLTQINLSNNKLKEISENVFAKNYRLVDINLANNHITNIEIKAFAQNHDLIKLNLHGNPIKVLATEILAYVPKLTWLDISNTELKSIFEGEHPKNMLKNLKYLNVAGNHIKSVKTSELEMFEKLDTMGLHGNPLECSNDFETLMIWLTKNKVSPTERDDMIANIEKESKDLVKPFTWQLLSQQVCKTDLKDIVFDPIPQNNHDVDIWEKIEKEENFGKDLKNELEKENNAQEITDDDDDEDDEGYGETDNDEEDYEDDDIDIKVDLKDQKVKINTSNRPNAINEDILRASMKLPIVNPEEDENDLDVDINVLFDEEDYLRARYSWLWSVLIIVLGALFVLVIIGKIVMLICQRKTRRSNYNSAIISAMSNQGKTRKDCGLVYQPLSEDLKGPATPKVNRYAQLKTASIISMESSPMNPEVLPEAV